MKPPSSLQKNDKKPTSMDIYFKEIDAYPILTIQQECELARSIRRGNKEALDRLVNSNLRFVVTVAKKFTNFGIPFEDLICEGNMGLIRAAQTFDEPKELKFISYAVWWIKRSIHKAIGDYSKAVRMPLNKSQVVNKTKKVSGVLLQKLQREPTREEIAKELGVSVSVINDTAPLLSDGLSLDDFVGNEDGDTFLDFLEDTSGHLPDHALAVESLNDCIELMLCNLTPKEARVLKLYYGLEGNDALEFKSIGIMLGLSGSRIQQIKEDALEKIRTLRAFGYMQSYDDSMV